MYRSKVCNQEFRYIVSGLDIRHELSKTDNPAQKIWFMFVRYHMLYTQAVFFFSENQYEHMASKLVVTANESLSQVTLVSFQQGAENFTASWPF